LKRNYWVAGSRTISGEVGNVKAAGDVSAFDAKISKLHIAGSLDIKNSFVRKLRVAGEVNAENTNFGDCKVAGEANIEGISKADIFVVVGDISADLLECRLLRNSTKKTGVTSKNAIEFSGSFKAETFESLYKFRLNCKYDFKNIISAAEFLYDGVLECENFYSFNTIEMKGINAENIYLYPTSASKLESLTGTYITISINNRLDKNFKLLPKTLPNSYYARLHSLPASLITISSIEGDKINIDHVKADMVSGLSVKIGDLCVIDKVEYKENIEISKKAIVNEVVKL
jgi:cytoskeletal protein CcmA (bactofilin family)